MNKKIFTITLGIITFIFAICTVITCLYLFYDSFFVNENSLEYQFPLFLFILLAFIIGTYVKLTNFGNSNENELTKVINEKKKLKELIEIAELEKKLKEINK